METSSLVHESTKTSSSEGFMKKIEESLELDTPTPLQRLLSTRVDLSSWATRGSLKLLHTRDQFQTLALIASEFACDVTTVRVDGRIRGKYPAVILFAVLIAVHGQVEHVLLFSTTRLVARNLDAGVHEVAAKILLCRTVLHDDLLRNYSDEFELGTEGPKDNSRLLNETPKAGMFEPHTVMASS